VVRKRIKYPEIRTFRGETFHIEYVYNDKYDAEKRAKFVRGFGFKARVVRVARGKWAVYVGPTRKYIR